MYGGQVSPTRKEASSEEPLGTFAALSEGIRGMFGASSDPEADTRGNASEFFSSSSLRGRTATKRHNDGAAGSPSGATSRGKVQGGLQGGKSGEINPDISWVRQLMDMDAARGVHTAHIPLPRPRQDSIQDGLEVYPQPEKLSDAESVNSVDSISGFIKAKWDPTVQHKRYLYPADRAAEFSEKWKADMGDFVGEEQLEVDAPTLLNKKQDAEQHREHVLQRQRLLRIREENLQKALEESEVFQTIRRPKTYEDEILLAKTFYDDIRRQRNLFD